MMNDPDRVQPVAPGNPRSRLWVGVRFALGLLVLLGLVVLLVRMLRPQLTSLGTLFVERFGLAGVMVGTFLADGFHFPIPPQFYMLLAIAAGRSPLGILLVTSAGSVLGGAAGVLCARRLGRIPRVARWLERSRGRLVVELTEVRAVRSAVVASFTPIAFSVLCYLAGFYRLPRTAVWALLLLRVPKLVLYYYLVSIGWRLG